MKKFYLIVTLLFISQLGQAQIDTTIQTTTETGVLESQHIIPVRACFLCVKGSRKRAFKFGYNNMSAIHQPLADYAGSITNLPSFVLGYEQRIATGFSVNMMMEWANILRKTDLLEEVKMEDVPLYQYNSTAFRNISFSIEPRWFFEKKQQIKEGISGNNLNGTYVGLKLSTNWWQDGTYITNEENPVNGRTNQRRHDHIGKRQVAVINFGWQHYLLDNNFINFQLGTGLSHNSQSLQSITASNGTDITIPAISKWKWLLNYQVTWGAVFGKRKKEDTSIDNFIEYYEEANDMWKIDLFNLFQGLNEKGATGRLHIAYERKISKSQFSIENGLQYLYSFDIDTKDYENQLLFQVEPRFYFQLRKDIRKGKAANNLSSIYLGFLNQWNISGADLSRRNNRYNYDLVWGAQLRFFENLYGDVRLGFGLQDRINNVDDYPLYYDFRFGFAF